MVNLLVSGLIPKYLALERLRHEDCDLEASLDYIARCCQKQTNKQMENS